MWHFMDKHVFAWCMHNNVAALHCDTCWYDTLNYLSSWPDCTVYYWKLEYGIGKGI